MKQRPPFPESKLFIVPRFRRLRAGRRAYRKHYDNSRVPWTLNNPTACGMSRQSRNLLRIGFPQLYKITLISSIDYFYVLESPSSLTISFLVDVKGQLDLGKSYLKRFFIASPIEEVDCYVDTPR